MTMKLIKKTGPALFEKVTEAASVIREKCATKPEVAIILGTGLGNLAKKIKVEESFAYSDLPHFPVSTVESHAGELIIGELAGKKVVAMEGRFHFYEGYSLEDVTFGVRVMHELGAKVLLVSNAAGGLNLDYQKGDLVLIKDQINFMGANPLIGPNDERLGPRFPDMSQPFSKRLMKLATEVAEKQSLNLHPGVYIGVTGPCLETAAEYRMMRNFGADVVGMSTVPEVIVGVHAGMETLGISVVTDLCDPDHLEAVDIKEIIQTANEAGPKLDKLFEGVVNQL